METPFHTTPTQRCLVYNKRTGHVIHVHDFIGIDSKSRLTTSEIEAQALTYVGDQIKKEDMALTEATGDLSASNIMYYIDIGTGAVVETTSDEDPRTITKDSPTRDSDDLCDIKRSLATWKNLSIAALLIAVSALVVGWLM